MYTNDTSVFACDFDTHDSDYATCLGLTADLALRRTDALFVVEKAKIANEGLRFADQY